jgi:transcriptional regulator with XRE-family HTH domain
MEFNEKLQKLRKQKNLTQEELADLLFVSRTAISKWESGRGYPSIDSLKTISAFFGVTIDELLSSKELLTIAEKETKEKETYLRDLVFGLLDISVAMFLFLPLFGQASTASIQEVSLLTLTEISPLLRFAYFAIIVISILTGILTLSLQNCRHRLWLKNKAPLSLALSALGALLFIISKQPYASTFLFILFIIKIVLIIKRQ